MIANSNRRAYAAVAIVILLSTVFAPRPGNPGVWLRELFEWLHVPVFGLVSLAILSMTPTSWRRSQRFGLALLGSIILGVLTEVVQIPMQRDASWEDLISDTAGAAKTNCWGRCGDIRNRYPSLVCHSPNYRHAGARASKLSISGHI
jgi:VanZ family protein